MRTLNFLTIYSVSPHSLWLISFRIILRRSFSKYCLTLNLPLVYAVHILGSFFSISSTSSRSSTSCKSFLLFLVTLRLLLLLELELELELEIRVELELELDVEADE